MRSAYQLTACFVLKLLRGGGRISITIFLAVIFRVHSWLIVLIGFGLDCLFSKPFKRAISWLLGMALLAPLMVLSQEVSGPQDFIGPLPEAMTGVDAKRDNMSRGFVNWAKDMDRFFGDARNYQEANDSLLQMDISRVIGYQGDGNSVLSFRANVNLPNTEKKLRLLLETDPDENLAGNTTKNQTPQITKSTAPKSYAAALRYEKSEAERWHFSTDGGIQMAGLASTPFVRARLSLAMPMEEWRLKVAESVFWFSTIGAGESTLIDFERTLSKPLLFRASSNATWLNNTQNFDLSQSFSVFHAVDERTALLYQMSVIGVSRPQTQVSDYVILMTYRYRLHREWVFFEMSPQIHYPRVENFHISTLLSMRLELLLDKSR